MSAHTPAPWQVSNGDYGISRVFSTAEDSRPFYLASEITREADAKLIAAAPILLQFLREAVNLVPESHDTEIWLENARAALAKAGL